MYKRILVGVDGSDTSLRGLQEAIRLAKSTGGTLLIVHVVNALLSADIGDYDKIIESLRQGGTKIVDAAAEQVRAAGVACERKVLESFGERPADLIVKEATASSADLIVVGTHGRRGLKRLALGSDAELVLRSSPVPVLMVRDRSEESKN